MAAGEEWKVVHERVVRRAEPSKDAKMLGMEKQGALLTGTVVDVDGVQWLKSPLSEGPDSFLMINGATVGLGTLLERATGDGSAPGPAEGDYYVVQGPLFKKPGSDPTTGKVVKLNRNVGGVVKTTGKTWKGPSGGEWVEINTASGDKPGWLLIEGPGFGVAGPMLEKAELGESSPITLKLFSLITSSELCELCIKQTHTIGLLKRWVALRDPHGLKPAKVLVATEMPSEEEQGSFSISTFPTHKLHADTTKVQDSGFKDGDCVPYFYMGESTDDGRFNQ